MHAHTYIHTLRACSKAAAQHSVSAATWHVNDLSIVVGG